MLGKVFKCAVSLIIWGVQLGIFVAAFYASASTIKYSPWFDSCTLGAFLLLFYIIPVQFAAIFIEYAFFPVNKLSKSYVALLIINLIAIGLTVMVASANAGLFNTAGYICAAVELVLITFWVLIPLKLLVRKKV